MVTTCTEANRRENKEDHSASRTNRIKDTRKTENMMDQCSKGRCKKIRHSKPDKKQSPLLLNTRLQVKRDAFMGKSQEVSKLDSTSTK